MLHEFDACAKFISELTRHDVSDLLKILLEDQHLCHKLMSSAVKPESSLQSLLKKVRSSLLVSNRQHFTTTICDLACSRCKAQTNAFGSLCDHCMMCVTGVATAR